MKAYHSFMTAVLLGVAAPAGIVALAPSPALAQGLPPAVGKPLQAAVDAAKKRNLPLAESKLAEARSKASDAAQRKKVGETAAYVYTATGQWAKAANELQAVGGTPAQLAPLYYRAGQYGNAIAAAKRAPNNPQMQEIIAQSYYQQGKLADAGKMYEQMLKSGRVDKGWLVNLSGIQYKMGDKKGYLATVERLIRLDPSRENWQRLLSELKKAGLPPAPQLALMMLMNETGTLGADDFQNFAKLSILGGQPGLAANALQKARDAGKLADDDMSRKLLEAATARAAASSSEAAKLLASAAPADQLKAGKLLLGNGDFARAIPALTKAAANNDPEALTQLGIAQIRAGQRPQGTATLKKVAATETPFAGVASLWALYGAVGA